MSCVAVTRNGTGDLWLFQTEAEAYDHPLIQYGDVVVAGPAHLIARWPVRDLPVVVRLARMGVPGRALEAEAEGWWQAAPSPKLTQQKREWAERVWPALLAAAKAPPQEPRKIVEQVRRDRALHPTVSKESRMAAAPKTEKTEKVGRNHNPDRLVAGHPVTAKIEFGTDAEGNTYGPKNSPKRAGTASAQRWLAYKAGATIGKCLDAGLTGADVKYDLEHGYIKIVA